MPALPALTRTYSCRANVPFQDVTSALNMSKSVLFSLAGHMINTIAGGTVGGTRHANSVWTVKGSCDSVTFNLAGTNLWTDITKVVFAAAGAAHSWIWLENATLGLQCVIDANPASNTTCRIAFSRIGVPFTGGSTTNAPLGGGEFCCGTTGTGVNATFTFITDQATGNFNWTHYITAEDGRFFFLCSRTGFAIFTTFLGVGKTDSPPAGDTENFFAIAHCIATGRGCPAYANIIGAANCTGRNVNGTVNTLGGLQTTGTFGASVYPGNHGVDAVTGNYNAYPIRVSSLGTQNAHRGLFPDIQFVGGAPVGGSIPSAAAQARVVVGDMIIPWPTVNPIV